MRTWMLRAACAAGGLVLGGVALAPATSAAPCAVMLTCAEQTPTPQPPPTTAPQTPPTTAPQMSSAEAAARLLSLLNGERSAAGLTPFTMRADVTEIADGWTSTMAERAHLAHNDAYFTKETRQRLDAQLLGENVAYNSSVDAAHEALMASPPHRANILDARFTVIGVAAQLHDRTWWVTQNFLQPASAAAPAPAPAAPTPAPMPTPVVPPPPAPTAAPSSAAPTPTPDAPSAPAATPVAAGEVLSAAAGDPVTAIVEPIEGSAAVTSSASTSMPSSRVIQLLVAALALCAAYALSWASASARIRCRWSPRCTSRA